MCPSVCREVERKCPFFILGHEDDKAAGNPSFICKGRTIGMGMMRIPEGTMHTFFWLSVNGYTMSTISYFQRHHTFARDNIQLQCLKMSDLPMCKS